MRTIGLAMIAVGIITIGTRDLSDLSRVPADDQRADRVQQVAGGVAVTCGLIVLTVGGTEARRQHRLTPV